jgi:hypothetical protein
MLAFVTSIRHPQNSNNFDQVIRLGELAINAVTNQTTENYHVYVVCNGIPEMDLRRPEKVSFIVVDFPPPSQLQKSQIAINDIRKDKGSKYVIGILAAAQCKAEYVMFFDADDFVSNRLAAFVAKETTAYSGWYFDKGYLHPFKTEIIRPLKQFHKLCGTSHILNTQELLSFLVDKVEIDSSQDEILENVDRFFIQKILGAHIEINDFFATHFNPLRPLPFPGAVYNLGTGENHSKIAFRSMGYLISPRIRKEFFFPPVSIRSCWNTIRYFFFFYPIEYLKRRWGI